MESLLTDDFLFAQVRKDVAMLYDAYVYHFGMNRDVLEIPTTTKLVTAFSCIFYLELKLVYGTTLFVAEKDKKGKVLRTSSRRPHYWLSWKDEDHVIDVLPADGKFGVSVPQAVLQTKSKRRFFPEKVIFQPEWDRDLREGFSRDVDDIAATLDSIMRKIPC